MRTGILLSLLVAGLASLPACRKATPWAGPLTHVPGTPHTDEVLSAWRAAGLLPEGFISTPPPAPNTAIYCERGKIRGVDTTVCEYEGDPALDRGMAQVRDDWARLDVHTGVLLRAQRTTMAAVDRERREPSGKTINEMAKAFRKLGGAR